MLADSPIKDVIAGASVDAVRVRSPHADHLVGLVQSGSVTATAVEPGLVELRGVTASQASARSPPRTGSCCTSSRRSSSSLEDAYMALTQDSVEYHAGGMGAGTHVATAPQGENR